MSSIHSYVIINIFLFIFSFLYVFFLFFFFNFFLLHIKHTLSPKRLATYFICTMFSRR